MLVPDKQRRFAVEVVRKLRQARFEAYWAGGCVRDELLGRLPKDFDVATNARPPEIRRLFGRRRTLAIGAAFGVITVLGPKESGQIEVATFRQDAAYSDGRHPDSVAFSTAQADASRRDFTINGLFYDPIDEQVIDYVGGQEDLRRGVLRAIGNPHERFEEDKLRMLRAVRFCTTFGFSLEADTLSAIRRMASEINAVSAERIAIEIERMLVDPSRTVAVRLLLETGLAPAILPEIVPHDDAEQARLDRALAVLEKLDQPSFPLVLAALLHDLTDLPGAERVCRRWRLSNQQTARVGWLVAHGASLRDTRSMRWSTLQPILIADGIEDLLALNEAMARAGSGDTSDVEYCRSLLEQPREVLDPPPLLTGNDLIEHGVPSGPAYRALLHQVRNAQLDHQIHTKAEALELVERWINENRNRSG